MFPFWDLVIEPVLGAVGTQRLVEIGALRGETTIRMLERMGPDAELHVIDPVPEFDPTEHEKRFPGRYIFHRDLSLNVLHTLPPMDAALIDGDHNWYTVYNECKGLADVSRAAGKPMPLMVLHDVGWPYGRRDLYYGPDGIPAEHRQPYEQKGMQIGKSKLVNGGGLNPTMYNAVDEGGPRNGVMTGLEDFIDEYQRDTGRKLRLVVLPIYFGLAIVCEQDTIDAHPELGAKLDHFESAEGRYELLELSEDIRLRNMIFQHNVFYHRERQIDRAIGKYLDLLKGALLDEHYLENELRINLLARRLKDGGKPFDVELRDPMRHMKDQWNELQTARRTGRLRTEAGELLSAFPYTTMGRIRLDQLQTALDDIREYKVAGDLVECGTGRGGGAIFLRGYLDAYEMLGKVWVADEFRAAPPGGGTEEFGGGPGFPEFGADLNNVRDGFDRFGLLDERVKFLNGEVIETLPRARIDKIALLRIGGDQGEMAAHILDELYDKVSVGGWVVVDDYLDPACNKAVDEFRAARGIDEDIERIDWSGAAWKKLRVPTAPEAGTDGDPNADTGFLGRLRKSRAERRSTTEARPIGAPLAPPVAAGTKDLSVVVVFYNMKREAARTLHSLTRTYQQGIGDRTYEVIVVENGSAPDQKLGEAFVKSFGREFRYLDMGDEAKPSPVFALNKGVEISSGRNIALMIDGAHVLTPGVLQYGLSGLELYEPAIVATQQWYVGPGQQPIAMAAGYDQAFEDGLFDDIAWPADGYRLFEIGHFIGERDWFDGMWESNCIFAPRALLEQVGAFDESFSVAGGGYANLELYERLGSAPGVRVATILGEGSFHQVHGGTTTNQSEPDERHGTIVGYAVHYADIRGRNYRGPGKRIHYVGTMFHDAMRTKSRRKTAPKLFQKNAKGDPDGRPTKAEPIPDELRVAYAEAYWRSLAWKRTSWLGQNVGRDPADLFAYQEIIHRVQPDWIIELRTFSGGRAFYLASLCDLVGKGRVLSIDDTERTDLPTHDRLQYLTVDETHGEATTARVREIVGDSVHGLVLLGGCASRPRTMREFETYHEFVGLGSYIIFEDTIVGGHPVWPSFGAGPAEAAREAALNYAQFSPDFKVEGHPITFNPGGYLKRTE
jgi:cephalosporin hydroxylase